MGSRLFKGTISSVLLISILLLISCSPKPATSTTTTQVYTVKLGTISSQLTPTGNLQMPHQTKLNFGVAGTISQIMVIMGQSVKKGDLLAKLDDASILTLQQALVQAQIDEKNAEVALETAETLTYNNNGSMNIPDPLNISIKQLALDKTKINLTNAQQNIDMATLEAPYDGIIAEVNSIVGDKVAANTQIMRIIDPTQLQVTALVNETDIFNVSLGLSATVQVTALSSVTMPATVTAISPAATVQGGVVSYNVQLTVTQGNALNSVLSQGSGLSQNTTGIGGSNAQRQGTGTLPNQAGRTNNSTASNNGSAVQRQSLPSGSGAAPVVPGATDNQSLRDVLSQRLTDSPTTTIPTLKEGLSVNVVITIKQDTNVIVVPSKAVTRQGKNNIVKVIHSDNTTEDRIVTVGMTDLSNKEITAGLTEGEKLLITTVIAAATSTTGSSSTQNSGTQVFQIPGLSTGGSTTITGGR